MMPPVRALAVVLCALALAGCYVSKTPLITPANADYPIAGRRAADRLCAGGRTIGAGCRAARCGAWATTMSIVEDGRTKPSLPFLLRRAAPGLYVAQLSRQRRSRKGARICL